MLVPRVQDKNRQCIVGNVTGIDARVGHGCVVAHNTLGQRQTGLKSRWRMQVDPASLSPWHSTTKIVAFPVGRNSDGEMRREENNPRNHIVMDLAHAGVRKTATQCTKTGTSPLKDVMTALIAVMLRHAWCGVSAAL